MMGDLVQDNEQKMAFDAQVTYRDTETYFPSNISLDIYAKPYIINVDATFTTLENNNTQMDLVIQIYGPASCNFKIEYRYVVQGDPFDGDDETDSPVQSLALTATVDNTIATRSVTDMSAWNAAIDTYESLSDITNPISSAAGNTYMDADIFVGGNHIADIDAGDNMFKIKFDDVIADNPNAFDDLLNDYIFPAHFDINPFLAMFASIQALRHPAPAAIPGCMDDTANNYNAAATEDDGSCTFDEVVSTGTVAGCMDDKANNYNPEATEDDGSCKYDKVVSTGAVGGCMDAGAINYNAAATEDDGSCEYAPLPSGEEQPVLGCMDVDATNYNAAATEDDGSCTYPPASIP